MWAKTSRGYVVEAGDDWEIGDRVLIPAWEPDEIVKISKEQIKFLGQVYGTQKEFSSYLRDKYDAPRGLEALPSYIFNLSDKDLKLFLVHMYSAGGRVYKHVSGTDKNPTLEVRLVLKHENLVREMQYLLLRLGVRTSPWYHKKNDQWWFNTSGFDAYVKMRDILKTTSSPMLRARIKELNWLIPPKYEKKLALGDQIIDRVVEFSDTGFYGIDYNVVDSEEEKLQEAGE